MREKDVTAVLVVRVKVAPTARTVEDTAVMVGRVAREPVEVKR